MTQRNVLPRREPPSRNNYCGQVRRLVLRIQAEHDLTDGELAERVRCSKGTIENARQRDGTSRLMPETLLNFEHEFGPGTIDGILKLAGSRAVPVDAVCATDANPAATLSEALALITAAQHPDSPSGYEVDGSEAAGMLPKLLAAKATIKALIAKAERYQDDLRSPLKVVG